MTSGHLPFHFQSSTLFSGNKVSYFQFSFTIYVCQLRSGISEVTQINQTKPVSAITANRAQGRQRHSQFVDTHVSCRTLCLLERSEENCFTRFRPIDTASNAAVYWNGWNKQPQFKFPYNVCFASTVMWPVSIRSTGWLSVPNWMNLMTLSLCIGQSALWHTDIATVSVS